MDIIKVIILGIVEGLTEFLPVSSTGHLILFSRFMALEGDFNDMFNIVIQSGAILAVIVYFWKKICPPLSKKAEGDLKSYISLWMKVVVAILPAGILGVLFDDQIEAVLFNPLTVAIALIVGAVILLIIESKPKTDKIIDEKDITFKDAFIVGCFQCLALIPGMSRSASTIIGGLIMGFKRSVAAEFSFFMAIPVILGASLIKLLKAGFDFTSHELLLLGIGTVVSFVVAYAVIAVFMNFIKKHDFKVFGYYRIALGAIVLISTLF